MAARAQPQESSDGDKTELDSVDVEFGNEYSEETLNIVRGVDKPTYMEESSSLDPVEDMEQYVENEVGLDPKVYDALQAYGQQQLQDQQAAAAQQVPPQVTDAVRYRQNLAEGTSYEDMTWLKLRAYHRAMNAMQAERDAAQAAEQQQRLKAYEVPVDKVPADLLNLTPAQLAERQKLALLASTKAAKAAEQRKSAIQRILSQPDPSEESEWATTSTQQQQQQQQQLTPMKLSMLQAIQQAMQQHTGQLQLLPPTAADAAASQLEAARAEPYNVGVDVTYGVAARQPEPRQLRTVYTSTYLEQQALKERLRQQARQRKAAFWLSFLTVTGAYVVRVMRRRLLKKPQGKAPAAKQGKQHGSQSSLASSKLQAL